MAINDLDASPYVSWLQSHYDPTTYAAQCATKQQTSSVVPTKRT